MWVFQEYVPLFTPLLLLMIAIYYLYQKLFSKIEAIPWSTSKDFCVRQISSVILINHRDKHETIKGVYVVYDRKFAQQVYSDAVPVVLEPYKYLVVPSKSFSHFGVSSNHQAEVSKAKLIEVFLIKRGQSGKFSIYKCSSSNMNDARFPYLVMPVVSHLIDGRVYGSSARYYIKFSNDAKVLGYLFVNGDGRMSGNCEIVQHASAPVDVLNDQCKLKEWVLEKSILKRPFDVEVCRLSIESR